MSDADVRPRCGGGRYNGGGAGSERSPLGAYAYLPKPLIFLCRCYAVSPYADATPSLVLAESVTYAISGAGLVYRLRHLRYWPSVAPTTSPVLAYADCGTERADRGTRMRAEMRRGRGQREQFEHAVCQTRLQSSLQTLDQALIDERK
eukprot:2397158-Rhodomonas_salina.1